MNSLAHQPPQIAHANGIDICYEIFGDADAEPMLLIMGLGGQMIHWEDDFCLQLAGRGFRVIRFDNRDIGHSTQAERRQARHPARTVQDAVFQYPDRGPYKLRDMAEDVTGLMDVLGSSRHIWSAFRWAA